MNRRKFFTFLCGASSASAVISQLKTANNIGATGFISDSWKDPLTGEYKHIDHYIDREAIMRDTNEMIEKLKQVEKLNDELAARGVHLNINNITTDDNLGKGWVQERDRAA